MNWYLAVLKKYAVFEGRARRKEYWMFLLFNIIVAFGLGLIEGVLGIAADSDVSIFGTIYQLAIIIPSFAVAIRRMHDNDRSGWWIFVPIANIIFLFTEGTKGANNYGPDPKAEEVVFA